MQETDAGPGTTGTTQDDNALVPLPSLESDGPRREESAAETPQCKGDTHTARDFQPDHVWDRALREASPSTGWRKTSVALGVAPGRPSSPDLLAAATRDDRPARYRRKHDGGRSL